MTELLASFIASFTAESISNSFIYLILLLLVSSVILAVLGKAPRFTASTANILTSLGILGTFAGIVVGPGLPHECLVFHRLTKTST